MTSGSGAASSGLKAGDVVIGLAGRTITDASELTATAHQHAAGTSVKVTYLRSGKELSTDVVFGSARAG